MAVSKRAGAVALVAVVAWGLGGCADVGLPGNVPLEEAENRQFRYSVYEVSGAAGGPATVLTFESREWLRSEAPVAVPDRVLRMVGAASDLELYAPVWEVAPHARMFVRAGPGQWYPVTPIL